MESMVLSDTHQKTRLLFDICGINDTTPTPPIRIESRNMTRTPNGNIFPVKRVRLPCQVLPGGYTPAAFVFNLSSQFDSVETVLGKHPRDVSLSVDIENGGILSGVVMVESRYVDSNGNLWIGHGSATVIDEHHVVTTAHNVWDDNLGLARSIKISRDHRVDPDDRYVDYGAVHYQWAHDLSKRNDFAVLRVSEPFHDGIRPLGYMKTPFDVGAMDFTVYGFPCDMPKDEDGEQLYQLCFSHSSFRDEPWNRNLIYHDGDTYYGNSGGPVVGPDGKMLAVHRGYRNLSPTGKINVAVAINHHGNDIEKFIQALRARAGMALSRDFLLIQGDALVDYPNAACFGWEQSQTL
ncbi:trypsin-like cysteine/serine peptidase domain-containing protein [Hypoxylon trugodes]|uniref:trypsin-like cysteine/serine peptidase domain-containing protein n=1 Tax=Hypoxylon trugodes TaxID=326681 RepID=UPI0021934560|nr:trypsin-like cysteine/serine peptidase domain-containing protein [Hypoxylon trugodes]KAI1393203.1 trypsin-like cysteine/serine peptidase domain-containing protein [Hypoxylon trugodes]